MAHVLLPCRAMYIPASFRETDPDALFALMREHPLGLLVSHGPDGLAASPLPFLAYPGEGGQGVLRAHLARANPHWRALAGVEECLVVFQGEQGYVTPDWYPSKAATHRVVPTWNYATVQAWGRPRVIDDAAWLRRQLDDLTYAQEGRRLRSWAVDEAPPDFIAAQMKAIVGIEIAVDRLEGKWKMSQNREPADQAGVVRGLSDPADPHHDPALAEVVAARCPAR